MIPGGWNIIYGIEAAHDQASTGLNGGMIGGQIIIPQRSFAELHGIVIAAGLGAAVGSKVLDAGGDFAGSLCIISL